MRMLPSLPVRTGTNRVPFPPFGGLDRRPGAVSGAICEMENLTGTLAPVLASRPARRRVRSLAGTPHGLISAGRLISAEGTRLLVDGAAAGTVSDTDKVFAALGERVVIFPDKLLWSPEGGLQPLEAAATVRCTFADGSYAGEPAAGNTILAPEGFDWGAVFRVGDAVTITGAALPENNKTPIVREIDGNALRFYENSFTVSDTPQTLTLRRTVPELDFLCAAENRIWGCRGDTVCCCALGDPTNWNVFDGLSTDAWSVETGTAGAFTGCAVLQGSPVFFKADRAVRVYGTRPQNFELLGGAVMGVAPGAAATVCALGEALFYLSPAGCARWGGGAAQTLDAPLQERFTGGAAGWDGRRCFFSARRADGTREMLVYDAAAGLWHREDAFTAQAFAFHGGALYAQSADALWIVGDAPEGDEPAFESSVTFADVTLDGFASNYPRRLWLRAEHAGPLRAEIAYNGGPFETAAALEPGEKRAETLALPLRRCDRFRLRLTAAGPWRLYALEIETRAERTNRKEG